MQQDSLHLDLHIIADEKATDCTGDMEGVLLVLHADTPQSVFMCYSSCHVLYHTEDT